MTRMKQLWAPWRIEYILGPKPDECVFCLPNAGEPSSLGASAHGEPACEAEACAKAEACARAEACADDEARLVLYRGQNCFVIMNKFPYSNGHLMVCPYRHVMALEKLEPAETTELMWLLQQCAIILKEHFHCEGLNIGLNQGQAAGAGIREHLHFHLVPRWNGDSSFMAVMDDVRAMPQYLGETYQSLKPHFARLQPEACEVLTLSGKMP